MPKLAPKTAPRHGRCQTTGMAAIVWNIAAQPAGRVVGYERAPRTRRPIRQISVQGNGNTDSNMSMNPVARGRLNEAPETSGVLQKITKIPLPGGTETVLVVDDASMLRNLLVRTLRRLGYRVLEASSALEAQRIANSHAGIHLLLTDCNMPGTDGMQLALWFRGMYPETKVLIASAHLWELDIHLSVSLQLAFLAKPFTVPELAFKMRCVLD
jgi:CheY-like chemotaxis protein